MVLTFPIFLIFDVLSCLDSSSSWTSLGSSLDDIFASKCAWLSSQTNGMRRPHDSNNESGIFLVTLFSSGFSLASSE